MSSHTAIPPKAQTNAQPFRLAGDRRAQIEAATTAEQRASPPMVSIGLPVYNGEPFLEAAIESLLAQTFADFELILSNNGSTDRTDAICRQFVAADPRVRYVSHRDNRGAAWNYNCVFSMSRGKYFKWAADDDAYLPNFLERCVETLDRNPATVLAYCEAAFIDERGGPVDARPRRLRVEAADPGVRFLDLVGAEHLITEIFGLIRRDVLQTTPLIGPYVGSDRVLLGRLALHGPFARIPERLFLHREHPGRSIYACPTAAAQAEWFDPTNQHQGDLWRWRHLRENVRSIIAAPLSRRRTVQLLGLLGWQAIRRGDKLAQQLAVCLAVAPQQARGPAAIWQWGRRAGSIALRGVGRCYAGLRLAKQRFSPRRR